MLPNTNQMDVRPAVTASTTPKMMMAAIQIAVDISVLPPFRQRPMRPLSAPMPSRTPAASHLFFGDRLVRKAEKALCSVSRGRGCCGVSGGVSVTAGCAGGGASSANMSAMDT